MPTGWPIEARLDLVREIYMAVGHNKKIERADSPKIDMFYLVKAILEDGPQFSCTARQTLIGTLRKTAVWPKVRPFLVNGDKSCGRKGCGHSTYYHDIGTDKSCSKVTTRYSNTVWPVKPIVISQTPCNCTGFVAKEFK